MPLLPADPKSPEPSRRYGAAMSLGTNLAAGIVGCTLVGVWLDRRFGTGQRCTLGGVALGLLYAGYEVWKVVRSLEEADRASRATPPDPKHD